MGGIEKPAAAKPQALECAEAHSSCNLSCVTSQKNLTEIQFHSKKSLFHRHYHLFHDVPSRQLINFLPSFILHELAIFKNTMKPLLESGKINFYCHLYIRFLFQFFPNIN